MKNMSLFDKVYIWIIDPLPMWIIVVMLAGASLVSKDLQISTRVMLFIASILMTALTVLTKKSEFDRLYHEEHDKISNPKYKGK